MIDIEAITARLSEATSGPWHRHGADVHGGVGVLFTGNDGSSEVRQQADADAEFVAHAPADIAALLDEIARLRALAS
jgi:hypothetical protein